MDRIAQVASEALGIDELRAGQLEAIQQVVEGRDTLAVMSTGYGKSAIYQTAGFLLDGPTIVISPLIALQRDQVEAIEERTPGEAAQLNSHVADTTRREILRDLAGGEREFVLLAPEQLAKPEVLDQLRESGPSLLVIDEAHCISEWGHDFRPDYLRLGAFAEMLGEPTMLALTATASPPVRREIVRRLNMRDPAIVIRGFDRPNLHLGVRQFREADEKRAALIEAVAEATPPGIVYVATRAGSEDLAEELKAKGVNAEAYHAGLSGSKREKLQEDFMEGRLDVIAATTAFGMGIDKENVRFVFHSEISDSVDSYYQEIGRAGRDGEPASACLFYLPQDQGLRRFFSATGQVEGEEIEQIAHVLAAQGGPVDPADLREELEISETKLLGAINRLEETGAVEVLPDGTVKKPPEAPPLEEAITEATEAAEERSAFDRSRLEMIRRYADHEGCRRDFILSYFGEEHEAPCGNCDNCEAGNGEEATNGSQPFAVGSQVEHAEWGVGDVQRYDDDQVVVLFESVGYKTLGVDLVLERGLLTEA